MYLSTGLPSAPSSSSISETEATAMSSIPSPVISSMNVTGTDSWKSSCTLPKSPLYSHISELSLPLMALMAGPRSHSSDHLSNTTMSETPSLFKSSPNMDGSPSINLWAKLYLSMSLRALNFSSTLGSRFKGMPVMVSSMIIPLPDGPQYLNPSSLTPSPLISPMMEIWDGSKFSIYEK